MRNTAVIMKEGIECLLKNIGAYETEIFITNILKEPFDYTEWQKKYFSFFSLEELNQMAVRYNKENPYTRQETGIKGKITGFSAGENKNNA